MLESATNDIKPSLLLLVFNLTGPSQRWREENQTGLRWFTRRNADSFQESGGLRTISSKLGLKNVDLTC